MHNYVLYAMELYAIFHLAIYHPSSVWTYIATSVGTTAVDIQRIIRCETKVSKVGRVDKMIKYY